MTRTDEQNLGSSATRKGNVISGPKIPYELLKGGIGNYIFTSCLKHKDKICQIEAETGAKDTYTSFLQKSVRVALAMKSRGIEKSDMIMHCSPNNLGSALPLAAGTYLGAISSSLDPALSVREAAHLVNLIQPKMIFVHEDSLELIEETLRMVGGCEAEVVVMGKTKGNRTSFEDFLVETGVEEDFRPIFVEDCEETIFVLFSSGTTGLPKGICLSHQSLYCGSMSHFEAIEDRSCLMHFSTFYWISALMLFTGCFLEGNKRLLVIGIDVDKACKLIEKYRVSHLFMGSAFLHLVTSKQDLHTLDLTCLKSVILTGGPASTDQMNKFRQALPHTYATVGYGMTELGGFISAYSLRDKALAKLNPNSCGKPFYGMHIKVVDVETGAVLGENKPGEIRVKYAYKMNGYYRQDSSSIYDEEGYIKTGDIGYFDETLSLYVCDRIKEMFSYQGWHIVPATIEGVIKEHPEVAQVVVFGVPDEFSGDLPAAVVVLVAGSKCSGREIEEFVAGKVLDRQRLRGGVHFVERIPTTPSGKMLRRKVKQEILEKLMKK